MDKYLLIVLTMLSVGMVFSVMHDPPNLLFFYAQLGGALIIITYTTIKKRRTLPKGKRR